MPAAETDETTRADQAYLDTVCGVVRDAAPRGAGAVVYSLLAATLDDRFHPRIDHRPSGIFVHLRGLSYGSVTVALFESAAVWTTRRGWGELLVEFALPADGRAVA